MRMDAPPLASAGPRPGRGPRQLCRRPRPARSGGPYVELAIAYALLAKRDSVRAKPPQDRHHKARKHDMASNASTRASGRNGNCRRRYTCPMPRATTERPAAS
jgi:hypothetical protein